jgi:hypothetical protein
VPPRRRSRAGFALGGVIGLVGTLAGASGWYDTRAQRRAVVASARRAMSTSPRANPWPLIEFPAVISDERAGASPPGIELFYVTHSDEPGAQVFVVVRCSPNSDAVGEQWIDVKPRRDIEIRNR